MDFVDPFEERQDLQILTMVIKMALCLAPVARFAIIKGEAATLNTVTDSQPVNRITCRRQWRECIELQPC